MPLLNVYRKIQPMHLWRRWRECELWVNHVNANDYRGIEAVFCDVDPQGPEQVKYGDPFPTWRAHESF